VESPQDSVIGENYYHTIPPQEAGTLVEYYFTAVDGAIPPHASVSDTFAYLAGRMLIWDDGVSEDILEGPPGTLGAVRFEGRPGDYVTSALVRIYTDPAHPLDSVKVYVWANSAGLPGAALAGPFEVWPASTPNIPEAWTWVDLRSAALVAPDTFFVGVELGATGLVPLGAISEDQPPQYFRSRYAFDQVWQADASGDYHIRCVVGDFTPNAVPPQPGPNTPAVPAPLLCPNPTNGAIKIVLPGQHLGSEIQLKLYDLLGRVVGSWQEPMLPEQTSLSITPSRPLAAGIYLLEVWFGEGLQPLHLKVVYLP
jgi:hypothetical protein